VLSRAASSTHFQSCNSSIVLESVLLMRIVAKPFQQFARLDVDGFIQA
jgi:hypothetical protein